MAKARKIDPCSRNSRCCLLDGHWKGLNSSCVIFKTEEQTDGSWLVYLLDANGEVLHELHLTHEPTNIQVRAAAVWLMDPGKLPQKLMQNLPELVGTVYDDRTDG